MIQLKIGPFSAEMYITACTACTASAAPWWALTPSRSSAIDNFSWDRPCPVGIELLPVLLTLSAVSPFRKIFPLMILSVLIG
jgi:hypothetical protein